jgi:hypothetical protein
MIRPMLDSCHLIESARAPGANGWETASCVKFASDERTFPHHAPPLFNGVTLPVQRRRVARAALVGDG